MDLPEARTFYGLLAEMTRHEPDRLLVRDYRRRLSYAQFVAEVRAAARGLYALGVRPGDKVAIFMGNQAEWLVVDFAVAAIGAVAVAMNTWWKRSELLYALEKADVRVLVMNDRYLGNDFSAIFRSMGDLRSQLPELNDIVVFGEDVPEGAMSFRAMLAGGTAVDEATIDHMIAAVDPDAPANILFTSGSTGGPKAVLLTHRGCIENCFQIGERMHLTSADRVLIAAALFWSASCINTLFATLTHGASIVVLHSVDAGDALRLIEEERCTSFNASPSLAFALYSHPDRAVRDLSSWRTGITLGAFDCLQDMGVHEATGAYGLTECYGLSAISDCTAPLDARMRNSGFPLPGVEIGIVDPETRRPLPRGEAGEIRLRGHVTPGYYKDPEKTAAAIDAERWFHTGDLGILETDGTLTWKARLKDLMKIGGISVSPGEIEAVLLSHPGIRQALVVGLPDPARGEIAGALVLRAPGPEGEKLDEASIAAHVRANAASYKLPGVVKLVSEDAEIPKTGTGKPHLPTIREVLLAERTRREKPQGQT